MTNIGLVTYVYEDYQDFIPLFVYSTLKNNPDIGIKIFLKEELTDYNRKTLEEVATNKVQVIENYSIRHIFDDLIIRLRANNKFS